MSVEYLRKHLIVGVRPSLLDLREPAAFHRGHIPGSANIAERHTSEIVRFVRQHPDTLLVCSDGRLAAVVARTLHFSGFTHVAWLEGGVEAWDRAGNPIWRQERTGVMRPVGRGCDEAGAAAGYIRRLTDVVSLRTALLGGALGTLLSLAYVFVFAR